MFDRIAPRYDLLNRLLSAGTDVGWRRRMARHVPSGENLRLLDLATGTGDQVFALLQSCPRITSAVGLDRSVGMLDVGRGKVVKRNLSAKVELREGDATSIPEGDAQYDVATISFGIRNVTSVPVALRDMLRVLRPGGRLLVLEFSLPRVAWFRALYLLYLRRILPVLGGWISGDAMAYRYLNETIETFPHGEAFLDLMREAGFVAVKADPLSFGIASIYIGERPA